MQGLLFSAKKSVKTAESLSGDLPARNIMKVSHLTTAAVMLGALAYANSFAQESKAGRTGEMRGKVSPVKKITESEKKAREAAEARDKKAAESAREASEARERASRTLLGACKTGDIQIVQTALKNGADANIKDEAGRTALAVAIEGGHVRIARILMTSGADPAIRASPDMLAKLEEEFRAAIVNEGVEGRSTLAGAGIPTTAWGFASAFTLEPVGSMPGFYKVRLESASDQIQYIDMNVVTFPLDELSIVRFKGTVPYPVASDAPIDEIRKKGPDPTGKSLMNLKLSNSGMMESMSMRGWHRSAGSGDKPLFGFSSSVTLPGGAPLANASSDTGTFITRATPRKPFRVFEGSVEFPLTFLLLTDGRMIHLHGKGKVFEDGTLLATY